MTEPDYSFVLPHHPCCYEQALRDIIKELDDLYGNGEEPISESADYIRELITERLDLLISLTKKDGNT